MLTFSSCDLVCPTDLHLCSVVSDWCRTMNWKEWHVSSSLAYWNLVPSTQRHVQRCATMPGEFWNIFSCWTEKYRLDSLSSAHLFINKTDGCSISMYQRQNFLAGHSVEQFGSASCEMCIKTGIPKFPSGADSGGIVENLNLPEPERSARLQKPWCEKPFKHSRTAPKFAERRAQRWRKGNNLCEYWTNTVEIYKFWPQNKRVKPSEWWGWSFSNYVLWEQLHLTLRGHRHRTVGGRWIKRAAVPSFVSMLDEISELCECSSQMSRCFSLWVMVIIKVIFLSTPSQLRDATDATWVYATQFWDLFVFFPGTHGSWQAELSSLSCVGWLHWHFEWTFRRISRSGFEHDGPT